MSRRLRPLSYSDRLGAVAKGGAPRGFGGRLPTQGAVTLDSLPAQARNPVPGVSHPGFWILVAASDAPQEWKRQAHFVCTGTDDHLVIEAADTLGASMVPDNAGEVLFPDSMSVDTFGIMLSPGSFFCGAGVDIQAATALVGMPGQTVIVRADTYTGTGALMAVVVANLYHTADPNGPYTSGRFTVRDVIFNNDGRGGDCLSNGGGAFLSVRNCAFVNCAEVGLNLFAAGEADGCLFEGCQVGVIIEASGTLGGRISGCTFTQNSTDIAVFGGPAVIDGCVFVSSGGWSGTLTDLSSSQAIYIGDNYVTVSGCTIVDGNYADAGIYIDGAYVTIQGVTGYLNDGPFLYLYQPAVLTVAGCMVEAAIGVQVSPSTFAYTREVTFHGCYLYGWTTAVELDLSGSSQTSQDVTLVGCVLATAGGDGLVAHDVKVRLSACVVRAESSSQYGVWVGAAGQVELDDVDVEGTWTSAYRIVGEQIATGREMVLEHVSVSSVVTSDPSDIDLTLSSDWGIQAADGDPYYDSAGATSGEEAELLHDPVTDAYFLREIA